VDAAPRDARGVASRPGEDEDAESAVRCSHIGCAQAVPARVVPQFGQVCENGSECPQRRFTCSVSQTPRAGFHVASGFGTEETSHVLGDDQGWAEVVDGVGHPGPQPGAGAGAEALAGAGVGHVLAGKPSRKDVHGLDLGPVDGGDVAEVGDVGVAVSEDPARPRVDFGHPCGRAAEDGLRADLKPAVPGEECAVAGPVRVGWSFA
jgi:hypothetical protein